VFSLVIPKGMFLISLTRFPAFVWLIAAGFSAKVSWFLDSRAMMFRATNIQKELKRLGDPETARFSQRFFKTGVGEYGEGDLFRGIRVPVLKRVAKEYQALALPETIKLLHSSYHEDRLVALLILNSQFFRGDNATRKTLYHLYLNNTRFINSWDLVDVSAPQIVGGFLWDEDRSVLSRLARSRLLWERRIAILATFHFIRRGEMADTLRIAPDAFVGSRRSNPQGRWLDAARSGKTQFEERRRVPKKALPPNAAHDVALCDRKISRARTAAVSKWDRLKRFALR
jgi:3-methyladenine DNA glycosylase AlkD